MSRNIRQKFPRTPVKATKRRGSDSSSSPDLSDDDGYSGVDDVSDSEDDEDGVDAAEEEHIINRELCKHHYSRSPRPDQSDNEDADEEDDEDDDEDAAAVGGEDAELSATSWNGISSDAEDNAPLSPPATEVSTPVKRQVRFTGVPDSDPDSDSTTSETDDAAAFFPDIFVDQTSLDPAFRREIEQDPDDVSSNGSYWDFHDTYGRPIDISHMGTLVELSSDDEAGGNLGESSTPVQSAEDGQELDGYDSDGETTEEDEPEPPARRKQLRRVKSEGEFSDSDTDRPIKFRRRQPRAVRFDLDGTGLKPVAFMHPISRKMIIFTPEKHNGFDLAPETFRSLPCFFPFNSTQSYPIASHSGSLMMSAMVSSHTFGDFVNSLPFGPEEAFMPITSPDLGMDDDSDFSGLYDREDEEEKNLKIEDFIQFQEETSGDEEAAQADYAPGMDADGDDESMPSRRPSNAETTASDADMDMHPLLAHFDNNAEAVGAFRRNQINQQLISSDKVTSESLPFSGPYSIGPLKGIKVGSLETVTAPLTPARRQKRGSLGDLDRSPLEAVAQKRKASGLVIEGNHKRHRSISDVRNIAL